MAKKKIRLFQPVVEREFKVTVDGDTYECRYPNPMIVEADIWPEISRMMGGVRKESYPEGVFTQVYIKSWLKHMIVKYPDGFPWDQSSPHKPYEGTSSEGEDRWYFDWGSINHPDGWSYIVRVWNEVYAHKIRFEKKNKEPDAARSNTPAPEKSKPDAAPVLPEDIPVYEPGD